MSHPYKLSLWTAILININIMFGTGLFINTIMLAKRTGFLGFVSYALVAMLIVPLIISFGHLLRRHPSGGFYTYGAQEVSPLVGFVSAWAYFIGKLASATLLIHVFSTLIQSVIPATAFVSPFVIDLLILGLFGWLNLYNLRTGRTVMYVFLFLKTTPILFIIFSCLYLAGLWSIPSQAFLWHAIPSTIPLVLYAFTGFEACCSLSGALQNPAKDGPRAITISYAMVVIITIVYQLLFFITMGPELIQQPNSLLNVFPPLLTTLWPLHPTLIKHLTALLHSAIATASLGGSYGILLSNQWNLYTLAQHGHVWYSSLFIRLNQHNIASLGVGLELFLCILYLFLMKGNVILLQQMSVLGCTITFMISMVALFKSISAEKSSRAAYLLPILSLGSCSIFLILCIQNFVSNGIFSLILFGFLLALGVGMFFHTNHYFPQDKAK